MTSYLPWKSKSYMKVLSQISSNVNDLLYTKTLFAFPYRIGSIKAPGFYFSKWEFGWGSIDILPAWGCNRDGVIFIRPNLEFWTIKSNKINQNTYADASIIELCFIILASVHVLWLILFDFKVVFEIHLLHVLILTVQISFGILYLGGVQFKMGFYSFNICFWVGF